MKYFVKFLFFLFLFLFLETQTSFAINEAPEDAVPGSIAAQDILPELDIDKHVPPGVIAGGEPDILEAPFTADGEPNISKAEALQYEIVFHAPLAARVQWTPLAAQVEVVAKIPDCERGFRQYVFRVQDIVKQDSQVIGRTLKKGDEIKIWNIGVGQDCGANRFLTNQSFSFNPGEQAVFLLHDWAFDKERFSDEKPFLASLIEYFQVQEDQVYTKNGFPITGIAQEGKRYKIHRAAIPTVRSSAADTSEPIRTLASKLDADQKVEAMALADFLHKLREIAKTTGQ